MVTHPARTTTCRTSLPSLDVFVTKVNRSIGTQDVQRHPEPPSTPGSDGVCECRIWADSSGLDRFVVLEPLQRRCYVTRR